MQGTAYGTIGLYSRRRSVLGWRVVGADHDMVLRWLTTQHSAPRIPHGGRPMLPDTCSCLGDDVARLPPL